jgi:hypothetical protein
MRSKPQKARGRDLMGDPVKQATPLSSEAGHILPIAIDKNGRMQIFDGQFRYLIAQQLGLESLRGTGRRQRTRG